MSEPVCADRPGDEPAPYRVEGSASYEMERAQTLDALVMMIRTELHAADLGHADVVPQDRCGPCASQARIAAAAVVHDFLSRGAEIERLRSLPRVLGPEHDECVAGQDLLRGHLVRVRAELKTVTDQRDGFRGTLEYVCSKLGLPESAASEPRVAGEAIHQCVKERDQLRAAVMPAEAENYIIDELADTNLPTFERARRVVALIKSWGVPSGGGTDAD